MVEVVNLFKGSKQRTATHITIEGRERNGGEGKRREEGRKAGRLEKDR